MELVTDTVKRTEERVHVRSVPVLEVSAIASKNFSSVLIETLLAFSYDLGRKVIFGPMGFASPNPKPEPDVSSSLLERGIKKKTDIDLACYFYSG